MNIEQQSPLAPLVLSLQATDATLEQVGGKGASLIRMVEAGQYYAA